MKVFWRGHWRKIKSLFMFPSKALDITYWAKLYQYFYESRTLKLGVKTELNQMSDPSNLSLLG